MILTPLPNNVCPLCNKPFQFGDDISPQVRYDFQINYIHVECWRKSKC